MLNYIEVALSPNEVPDEVSLCIYISGCQNRCKNCHYPELQRCDYGDPLRENYEEILEAYRSMATCVCFLGEGLNGEEEHREFLSMIGFARRLGLRTCLYSGRDVEPEGWMSDFDYLKLGSYKERLGDLSAKTTNQRMLRKTEDGYEDITYMFW